jgi:hypothetical protein
MNEPRTHTHRYILHWYSDWLSASDRSEQQRLKYIPVDIVVNFGYRS